MIALIAKGTQGLIIFTKYRRYSWCCSIAVLFIEGVVEQLCNPLTLQSEQSGGVGSIPCRAPPLERHDKGPRTRLALRYFCDPSAWF